jgi:hypothetical protein
MPMLLVGDHHSLSDIASPPASVTTNGRYDHLSDLTASRSTSWRKVLAPGKRVRTCPLVPIGFLDVRPALRSRSSALANRQRHSPPQKCSVADRLYAAYLSLSRPDAHGRIPNATIFALMGARPRRAAPFPPVPARFPNTSQVSTTRAAD